MLRMNTKKAIENAKKHFLDYYDGNKKVFLNDGQNAGGYTDYQHGVRMAAGGCFACYYWDQRNAIREILEETEEESNRYTDQQVFDTYCHIAGKVFERLAIEFSNEFSTRKGV